MQTVIVSNHKLNNMSICPRYFKYSSIDEIEPIEKEPYLEEGDLFHQMLDMHYKSKMGTNPMTSDQIIEAARNIVTGMDLSVEEGEGAIESYLEYIDFYANEDWQIEASEAPFVKELYIDDDIRILVEGKTDILATAARSGERIVVDHKRSGRDTQPSIRDNQKLCYAWATDRSTFIINFVGTQKSKKLHERMKRYSFQISQHLIDEWIESAIYWTMEMLRHQKMGIWPANYLGCSKFGKPCTYAEICNTTPDNRAYKISTIYKPRVKHELFKAATRS